MGTAEDEYKAREALELIRLQNEQKFREQAAAVEEYRRQQEAKAAEEAAKGKMVADEPAVPNWPDDGYQAAPGRLDGVKGALGIGAAGDVAFAGRLLNDGRPPAADAVTEHAGAQADGAKERHGAAVTARAAQAFGR